MPSSSKKQHNFMEAVAHNPAFAKKAGVPKKVGEDFSQADKGKKFSKGGNMAAKETMGPRSMSEDVEKGSNKMAKFGESKVQKRGHTKDIEEKMSGSTTGMKRGGKAVKKMASGGMASSRADGIAQKGKTKGKFC
jgi:hypothetical protein